MLFEANRNDIKNKLNTIVNSSIVKRKSISSIASNIKLKGKANLKDILYNIKLNVLNKLNKYAEQCDVIYNEKDLFEYIEYANKNGVIAIDTETTGLDVRKVELVGISLYTIGKKAIYIPINHINSLTMQLYKNQLSIDKVKNCLLKISAKIIMHNANYDIRVLKNTIGIDLKCDYDTFIAERLLINGLEFSAGLKAAYSRRMALKEEMLSFDKYFEGITFNLIPIEYGYIYAAMDAKITFDLYEMQLKKFEMETNKKLFELFNTVEMPVLETVIKMENRGIGFDYKQNELLKTKYNELIKEKLDTLDDLLKEHYREVNNYRLLNGKLDNPINYSSPTQIAIVLYDILKYSPIDNRKTGEHILKKYNTDFTKTLLEYRELQKLLTTYIDNMIDIVDSGRVYTNFNQMGTVTGRFSSSEPNLQNIPTKAEIRSMFIPDENFYLLSCDYSGQEPRIVAHLSQDPIMIKAFKENKDFYAFLGSNAYKLPYEKCLESYKEYDRNGNIVFDGKKIRTKSKSCFLGVIYGMGVNHLAESLNIDIEEAMDALNKIYDACPGLLMLKDESIRFGKKHGYVNTLYGRRRYIKNIQLPYYAFSYDKNFVIPFDPFNFDTEIDNNKYIERVENEWLTALNKAKGWKQKEYVKSQATKEGVYINSNGGLIAESERFSINTRVQGTAADMMKKAMILIDNDIELKQLGFELLLTVHDEIIGQMPIENTKRVVEIVNKKMLEPTLEYLVPFKCDVVVMDRWEGNIIEVENN